ncbi:MAG: SRPBCC family protein [Bacteroidota bacterium]
MKVYTKKWTQFVPRPMDEVWAFFSRPENLNEVTPQEMNFEILSDIAGKPMYEGMIINYKVSPVFGIRMRWTTEIQVIKEQEYFVDEQRFGPYAMWHHEHHFREADGGVYMTDLLNYAIPFGPIGWLANALFVDAKIEEIFRFRVQAVERLFGKPKRQMV